MLYQYALKLLLVASPWLSREERETQATDIARVAKDDIQVRMLVTTGVIETGFRERFTRCECKPGECDNGAALSVYQLHSFWYVPYSRDQVCSSNYLATWLASKALTSLRKQVGPREALRIYVGERVSDSDPRIKARFELWDWLSKL